MRSVICRMLHEMNTIFLYAEGACPDEAFYLCQYDATYASLLPTNPPTACLPKAPPACLGGGVWVAPVNVVHRRCQRCIKWRPRCRCHELLELHAAGDSNHRTGNQRVVQHKAQRQAGARHAPLSRQLAVGRHCSRVQGRRKGREGRSSKWPVAGWGHESHAEMHSRGWAGRQAGDRQAMPGRRPPTCFVHIRLWAVPRLRLGVPPPVPIQPAVAAWPKTQEINVAAKLC